MNEKMLKYIAKRFLLAVFTIFLVISITFFVMHAIPASPFSSEKARSDAVIAALEAKYGFDKPVGVQFLNYLKGILHLDFGLSTGWGGNTVAGLIKGGLGYSARIGFTAAVIAIILGIVFGSVAAINRPDLTPDGRLVDWAVVATKKKIRSMLRIGLLHGHDAIVLGAWGCGAFRNPPEHMASLFHEVLREPEFAGKYRGVRFAVIEDHNSRHSNFAPFDREFN